MSGMNKAVVPQEEAKRSRTNLYPVGLGSFSPSLPTCILSGPLSRDSSHKTSSYKRDIYTHKVNFMLKTVCLGIVLFAKQEIVYFVFKGVPAGHTYSNCWEGKQRGLWVTWTCFFFPSEYSWEVWLCDTFQGGPLGGVTWGQNRKTPK